MTYRRNLVRSPNGADLTDWHSDANIGAGATIASLTGAGPNGMKGYVRSTANQALTRLGVNIGLAAGSPGTGPQPIVPGKAYTFSAWVRPVTTNTVTASLILQWLDAAGAQVGTNASISGVAVAQNTFTGNQVAVTNAIAPAGAVRALLFVRMFGTIVNTDKVDVTSVNLEPDAIAVGSPQVIMGGYNGAFFDGADNLSTSTLYAFGDATLVGATVPGPTVGIIWADADLADNVATMTVYRVINGVESIVRRANQHFALGGLVTADAEAPAGVEIGYYGKVYRADDVLLGSTPIALITLTPDPIDTGIENLDIAWISDPLDETSVIAVELTETAGAKPSKPVIGQKYLVGARTVVLTGRRSDIIGLDMGFYVSGLDQKEAVDDLVTASGGLLLIRTMPPRMIPRMLYCWMQNPIPDEFNLGAGIPDIEFDNTVDQTSMPDGDASVVAVPWQVYIDAFPTWTDAQAAYTSWFDGMSNPPGV